jgi:peroxiredoxin Q/BCP
MEVCSLRDAAEILETIGVDVYTVSLDSVQELADYAKNQSLPFALLSDPDGSGAMKYGVLAGKYAKRVTFIIDDKGVLRRTIDKVSVKTHGEDMAVLVEALMAD